MQKRFPFSFTLTLIILAFASLPCLVLAAGIQVSPAQLDVSGPAGKIVRENIVVANPTPDVQLFEVSADDFDKNIQPRPASFTLEAGSRKTVTLDITPLPGQRLSTTISVVGHPLAGARLQTNTGVKIPITVSTVASQKLPGWVWPVVGGTLLLLLGLLGWKNTTAWRRRKGPT